MKTVVNPDLKSKTFYRSKSYSRFREKEINQYDFKFYQKLFVVLISLSTFLIFSESPKELGNICKDYNSSKSCNVW